MNRKSLTDSSGENESQAEAAIRHRISGGKLDEDLKNILDTNPQAVILTNSLGQVWYLNKNAQTLLGETRQLEEPVPWRQLLDVYLEDGLTVYPESRVPLQLALTGKSVQDIQMILRVEGEEDEKWVTMSAHPLIRGDGEIVGAITYLQDITSQKQLELSSQQYIKRMDAIYRLSHHIAGAGNDIKNLSRAAARFASKFIGDLSIVVLKDSDDLGLAMSAFFDTSPEGSDLIREQLVDNEQFDGEDGIVGQVIKSGEPLLLSSIDAENLKTITAPVLKAYYDRLGLESMLIVPLIGRGGIVGVISLCRHRGNKPFNKEDQSFLMDIAFRTALAIENCRLFESLRLEISERLSTKLQLDSTEERFQSIFHSTTLGIKLLDVDGNILQTNAAFQNMIGYSELELFGRHFSDFLYDDDVPRALKLIQDLKITGGVQYLFEHRAVHKDDSRIWVKTTFSPVRMRKQSNRLVYIVGIVENITEQKQIEQEMRELRDRLHTSIEKERLRLAQELHDNPMQTLYTVLYRVEELRPLAQHPVSEKLKNITSDIKLVLDDLRATAKELRPPTIFSFGLENAIRSYAEDFKRRYPDLLISLSLAEDRQLLPEEMRLALFRIFQQALINVMRHSGATEVKVLFSFNAEEVQLEIKDNGKGFQVPSNWITYVRNGHYGLAGAVERANSMGGILQVRSEPGKSTTITALIPLKDHKERLTGSRG